MTLEKMFYATNEYEGKMQMTFVVNEIKRKIYCSSTK